MTPGYEDKAEKRRQKFGIDHPHAPDSAPSSVDQAISGSNKGHKLLQKLGWKSGEGLGKSQAGIVEPVSNVMYNICVYSRFSIGGVTTFDSL